MMVGTCSEQWEVYVSWNGDDPLYGEFLGCGLTMAEAVSDAFSIPVEKILRRNGIGSGV